MTERIKALLPEFVLGTLDAEETAEVERALADSPSLVEEVRAINEAFETMAMSLEPVAPKPETKIRLLDTLSTEARFLPFLDDLAGYFDLAAEKVRSLLTLIDDATAWTAGPMPGIKIIDFEGGPNAFAVDTGFVSFPAGLDFPYHVHQGPEMTYVLQGKLRDDDGTVYGPGDVLIKQKGTGHSYEVLDDEELVIAIAHVGFDVVPDPS